MDHRKGKPSLNTEFLDVLGTFLALSLLRNHSSFHHRPGNALAYPTE